MIPSPCLEEARQIIDGHDEAAGYDAGFDGGEFSVAAHHEQMMREIRELAARYGVDPDDLLSEAMPTPPMSDEEMAGWSDSQERVP